MNHLIMTIMLLFGVNLLGQELNLNDIPKDILEKLDRMGVDDLPLLNNCESTFLNEIFKDSLNGFDFTEKKVGFVTFSKMDYFDMQKKHLFDQNSPCNNGTLYIFDANQKLESGGYDAAILHWSKFLLPIEEIVKRLKNIKSSNVNE